MVESVHGVIQLVEASQVDLLRLQLLDHRFAWAEHPGVAARLYDRQGTESIDSTRDCGVFRLFHVGLRVASEA
jgi:hypothetical protein